MKKLTPEILSRFMDLACALSPENLTMDGDLPEREVNKRRANLEARWAKLEREVGRKVTEDEVYKAEFEVEAASEVDDRKRADAQDVNDEMDGDHATALASAGFGTDEDYGGGDERL